MSIPSEGLPDAATTGLDGNLRTTLPPPVSQGPEHGSALSVFRFMAEQGLHGGVELASERNQAAPHSGGTHVVDAESLDRRYDLGREVGRGGMGAVISACDRDLHRDVAMKVMRPPRDRNRRDVVRFIEEAQIAAQLEHPSIVPVHEVGVDANRRPYYTMKFVKGRTMKEVLEGIYLGNATILREFPLSYLLTVFQKICDGVAFAHSKHVIHRDIKPDNVMIGDFGEVLVMDWGLAKLFSRKGFRLHGLRKSHPADAAKNHEDPWLVGEVIGTPEFMAPEQARGLTDELDERTDVYALGAILYTILSLHPPIKAGSSNEAIELAARGELRDIYETDPSLLRHLPGNSIPESLAAVAMKALSHRPERRYSHVKALQADIAAYQNGYATVAERANAWRQIQLLIMRQRAAAITVGVVTVLLLAASWVNYRARVTAVRAEVRAVEALKRLRGTAPDLGEAAKKLLADRRPAAALQRASYAAELDPDNEDYWCIVGNCNQVMLCLREAVAAYDRAVKINPACHDAVKNRALCQMFLAKMDSSGRLSKADGEEFCRALRAQGRAGDALIVAERLALPIPAGSR